MLQFHKAALFLPLHRSNLSISLRTKTLYSEVLQFSEFIKTVSILYYTFIDLIMLLYKFLVISFDGYKE